jgi:prepilin-type N-terminal cleavage/methylation domain-containing protein
VKKKSGFTLIEILIVAAIISIIAGVATLSFNSIRQREQVSSFIDDFTRFFDKARMHATLSLQNYRVLINNQRIALALQTDDGWDTNHAISLPLPEDAKLILYTAQGIQNIEDKDNEELLLTINNAGIVSAFELHVMHEGITHIFDVASGGKIDYETR